MNGYERNPVDDEFDSWAGVPREREIDEDVDWAALYNEHR